MKRPQNFTSLTLSFSYIHFGPIWPLFIPKLFLDFEKKKPLVILHSFPMWPQHRMSLWRRWGVWWTSERILYDLSGKLWLLSWLEGAADGATLWNIYWNKKEMCGGLTTNFCFSIFFAGIRMILTAHRRIQEIPRFFTVLNSALILMPEWLLHYTVRPLRSLPMGWQCKFPLRSTLSKVSAVKWC